LFNFLGREIRGIFTVDFLRKRDLSVESKVPVAGLEE